MPQRLAVSIWLAVPILLAVFTVPIATTCGEDPALPDDPQVAKQAAPWIGVMCHPPTEALRAQLDLPEGQGLVVGNVVPESPAARSGIRRNDVLLKADGQALTGIGDLARIVEQSGEKAIAIDLLRRGERQTIEVTATPRPDHLPRAIAVPGPDQQALREWVERLAPRENGPPGRKRRFRLRFVHPGRILGGSDLAETFPKDLSITFEREGDEPLKITVEKDGEKWVANQDALEKLPENLLPLVEKMLGDRGFPAVPDDLLDLDLPNIKLPDVDLPDVDLPQVILPDGVQHEPPAAAVPQRPRRRRQFDDQLEELLQRLGRLEKRLEAMQESDGAERGRDGETLKEDDTADD